MGDKIAVWGILDEFLERRQIVLLRDPTLPRSPAWALLPLLASTVKGPVVIQGLTISYRVFSPRGWSSRGNYRSKVKEVYDQDSGTDFTFTIQEKREKAFIKHEEVVKMIVGSQYGGEGKTNRGLFLAL